jgi:hypothetical protein
MPFYTGPAEGCGPAKTRQIRGQHPESSAQEGDKVAPGIGVVAQAVYQDNDRFYVLRRKGCRLRIIIKECLFILMKVEYPAQGGKRGPRLHGRYRTPQHAAAGVKDHGVFTRH